jgi:hypothetical protein
LLEFYYFLSTLKTIKLDDRSHFWKITVHKTILNQIISYKKGKCINNAQIYDKMDPFYSLALKTLCKCTYLTCKFEATIYIYMTTTIV